MSGTKRKRLDWHPEAIADLAESLAWYAKHNPAAARRMRKAIEEAAHSLVASPIAVSGRLGVVAGTRELPVGQRIPFTPIFVRHNPLAIAPFSIACTNGGNTRPMKANEKMPHPSQPVPE